MGPVSSKGSIQAQAGKSSSTTDKPDCDLEIFLMGKTGHGKSATGNTILGRKKFTTSDMAQSATLETDAGWVEREGKTVKVVDGPGLLDTRMAGVKQLEQMEDNLSKGFLHCPNGFHALVLVLSYGTRFTDEEKKTVALLKGMLGDNFIKEHCIILFTHGENYEMNNPGGNFKEWCEKQKGPLRELLDECCNRVVLFYNLTPDKREESTKELISLASGLGKRYTAALFDQIRRKRFHFIQEQGAIQLKGLIQSKIDMIIDFLEKGETGDRLKRQVDKLESEIEKESPDLKVVQDVKKGIKQTRDEEYTKALETFKNIEYEGRKMLLSLHEILLILLVEMLKPLFELFD